MPKHQTLTPTGIVAHIRIHGQLHQKRFPKHTDPSTIRTWLLATEMRFRGKRSKRTGRFEDDARAYLDAVKAMPSFSDRTAHIEEWIAVFGSQYRHLITSDQIAAQLASWRTTPRTVTYTRVKTEKQPKASTRVLSASSVNKRRTALMHLYSVLDGKAAFNPVKDVPKYREPTPQARHLPYSAIRLLWRVMRDTPTRARLQMMAYTGLTHGQLAKLTRDSIDLTAKTIRVPGRAKGTGTPDSVRPLTAAGVRACRALIRTDAFGPFARSTLRRDFRAACAKVPALASLVQRLTPYDLRHSFGTELFRSSGDIRATQVLMGHSTPTLTHRYTVGAVDERLTRAVAQFGKRRGV